MGWLYTMVMALTTLGIVLVLQTRKERYAIVGFLWITVCLSILYFLQGASFLAGMQIIIQAGIVVVWLITDAWFGQSKQPFPFKQRQATMHWIIGGIVAITTTLASYYLCSYHQFRFASSIPHVATTTHIASTFVIDYGLAFELVSIFVLFVWVVVADCFAKLDE